MVNFNGEVFILTNEELEAVKKHSLKLMEVLPKHDMTALLAITFLKKHMEDAIGKKAIGIEVIDQQGRRMR